MEQIIGSAVSGGILITILSVYHRMVIKPRLGICMEEKRLKMVEDDTKDNTTVLVAVKQDVAVIKNDTKWIKKYLEKNGNGKGKGK